METLNQPNSNHPGTNQLDRPNRLLILDFAGTLSLQTVLFGREDRLEWALKRSGLAQLGYRDPSRFWEELVFPTWEEGGLTPKGYARVLAERMEELLGKRSGLEGKRLHEIARRFVQLYFRHSPIDAGWKPLFQGTAWSTGLATRRLTIPTPRHTILIATDHYAECSTFLRRFLHRWGIQSVRIVKGTSYRNSIVQQNAPAVFIANSADLGAWKQDPAFWEQVGTHLPIQTFRRIVLVDDFGYNEHRGDPYADRKRVEQRRDSILRCLSKMGATQDSQGASHDSERDSQASQVGPPNSLRASRVEVFPFFLNSSVTDTPLVDLYEEYRTLVSRSLLFLRDPH